MKDTALLRQHISVMEQTLLASGIGIPNMPGLLGEYPGVGTTGTPYDLSSVPSSIPCSVPSSTGREDPFSNVTIDLRDMHSVEPERWCSAVAAETDPRLYEAPSFEPFMWENLAPPETGSSGASHGEIDSQAGINFILE